MSFSLQKPILDGYDACSENNNFSWIRKKDIPDLKMRILGALKLLSWMRNKIQHILPMAEVFVAQDNHVSSTPQNNGLNCRDLVGTTFNIKAK